MAFTDLAGADNGGFDFAVSWYTLKKGSITPAPSTLFLYPQQDSKGRRKVNFLGL